MGTVPRGVLNPVWTDYPQITVLCDVYDAEETTARLVYSESFLPITAVTMQFLLVPGRKK